MANYHLAPAVQVEAVCPFHLLTLVSNRCPNCRLAFGPTHESDPLLDHQEEAQRYITVVKFWDEEGGV